MDWKKLIKQIAIILGLTLTLTSFDFAIYKVVTERCVSNFNLDNTSIEVQFYRPFFSYNRLTKINSSLKYNEVDGLPVVDGATALLPIYASMVEAIYPEEAVENNFDLNYSGYYSKDSKMQFNNTTGAYKKLVDGEVDLIFCAYPGQSQIDYATEKGVEFEYVPIGLESFVFLVNKNNPVDNLTLDQVKDIYAGKITNWSQVGGPFRTIDALQRSEGSGSQSAMQRLMGDTPMVKRPFTFIGASIGFSFRFYVQDIVKNTNVKMLSLNGFYPNIENIKNKTYPITSNFYCVYRKGYNNQKMFEILDWLQGPEGQKLITDVGYVGLN